MKWGKKKNDDVLKSFETDDFDGLVNNVSSVLKVVRLRKIFKLALICVSIVALILVSWTVASLVWNQRNQGGISPDTNVIIDKNFNKDLQISQETSLVDGGELLIKSNQYIETCNLKYVWQRSHNVYENIWHAITNESRDGFNLLLTNQAKTNWLTTYVRLVVYRGNDIFKASNNLLVKVS